MDPDFQDYINPSTQLWLDGICTEPGIVRQFVAMPLGEGYTIEEQLTGSAEVGGIQLDLFEALREDVNFTMIGLEGDDLAVSIGDFTKTPAELKIEGKLTMKCM